MMRWERERERAINDEILERERYNWRDIRERERERERERAIIDEILERERERESYNWRRY